MALPLLALAVALVLALVAAVLTVLLKLVLWVSVSRSLLVLVAAALYWFVASRRRRYARGFYSCSQVPATPVTTADEMVDVDNVAQSDKMLVAVRTEESELAATCVHQLATSDDAVPTTTEAPVADTDVTKIDAATEEVVSDSGHGVKVSPVRRRSSMQLPAPLALKLKGDASSPSLSATESEDDDDELALGTRSFASSRSTTSPMCATSVSPAPIASAARKVRPRSSSSSSGFSAANRKRLVGSPVNCHAHMLNPHHAAMPPTMRPHSNSTTPVRNRRSATITTNHHHPSSSASSSSSAHNKRNSFVRRSAASERELMQEKMAADGYWIGDFRLERQLVPRRSTASAASNNGDRSGNNSARSSPR